MIKYFYYLIYFFLAISGILLIMLLTATLQPFKYDKDFYYIADVKSVDNFYNDVKQDYDTPQLTDSNFSYQYIGEDGGNSLIKNVFEVRDVLGNLIFATERLYCINPNTGAHVKRCGDKDREGYLFAPPNNSTDNFQYWHVNYDAPAPMTFLGEERINGFKVNKFHASYTADQTDNLHHLNGVPDQYGILVEIELDIWVEPITGIMVKYTDKTIAWFYDIDTKEKIKPWNKFSNTIVDESIHNQIKNIEKEIILKKYLYGS